MVNKGSMQVTTRKLQAKFEKITIGTMTFLATRGPGGSLNIAYKVVPNGTAGSNIIQFKKESLACMEVTPEDIKQVQKKIRVSFENRALA